MPRLAEQLMKGLNKLDAQSFRPGDSLAVSAINHPLDAVKKFGEFLARQTNTAAGIPDQYDNPYPLLAPSPDAQAQAAFDVAGSAQVGAFPFAPKSAGGTLGTIETFYHGGPLKKDTFDGHTFWTRNPTQAAEYGAGYVKKGDVPEVYAIKADIDGKVFDGNDYANWRDDMTDVENWQEQTEAIRRAINDGAEVVGFDDGLVITNANQYGPKRLRTPIWRQRELWDDFNIQPPKNQLDDQIPNIVERNGQPLQSDNLNAGLLAKYLREGQLSPQELAQYETNAVQMTDSGKHHFNLSNANAQGGTPESRAVGLGFDTPAFHGTNYPGFDEFMTTGADYSKTEGTGAFFSNNPELASSYTDIDYPSAKPSVYPVNLRLGKTRNINANGANWDDVRGKTTDEITRAARNSGKYDSVKFKNVNDAGMGGYDIQGDTIAIFNPNQIRSRFAAFDPLRKDSANLLASRLLPATMLGYGMANQQDIDPLTWALSQP